jgi:DNA-binding response OmpR family regulator
VCGLGRPAGGAPPKVTFCSSGPVRVAASLTLESVDPVTSTPLHVLLLDDDPKFRALTAQGLRESGVTATTFADGAALLAALADGLVAEANVLLLDVMMPRTTGWEVLAEIRRRELDLPVIFVTAREHVDERVRGLQMGADDYLIKPFDFTELLARIHAVVRRSSSVPGLTLGSLRLDPQTRQVRSGTARVELSPKEFDLLRVLLEHPAKILSRATLLQKVWGTERDPGTNVVEVHVSRLRRKLGGMDSPTLRTIRGEGYTLEEGDR